MSEPTPTQPTPDEIAPAEVPAHPTPDAARTISSNPFVQDAPKPATPNTRLPWILVAVLTVVSALLAGMLIAQQGELNRLRGTTPAAPATTNPGTTTAPPPANADLPQPVTDPAALEMIAKLPHRKADDPLALGKVDAPVVMIAWSDFRCPFCSKWERETLSSLQPYVDSGTLRIEHRDLVLFGEDSQRTAVAARAAGQQGKFWEFASVVAKYAPLSGHPAIDDATVLKYAQEAGVPDIAKFTADTKLPALDEAVKADTAEAQRIGITGTPFFLVNNTPINGAQPNAIFAAVIEANGGKK